MSDLRELLEDIEEFLEPFVDVRDGSDGPRPNKAISLQQRVHDALLDIEGEEIRDEQERNYNQMIGESLKR